MDAMQLSCQSPFLVALAISCLLYETEDKRKKQLSQQQEMYHYHDAQLIFHKNPTLFLRSSIDFSTSM